ncbi:ATP-binding protein [Cyanobium gracile UHCC 0139]|uniref:histidine kinase n=1 Tax=Cyanobium gracile UHCC 0139 TaxID=3110308 RepID=A0ABU5RRM2_9CYAN|nr:ATP-binding protein [Cyanobium gracile]MEA5390384.1 ATP-binding protein [Cyanobium gracile UHCC 0139]
MPDLELVAQLRTTLGRLEAALGAVEEALAFTDLDGIVEWTNTSFDRFVGLSRLQCLGRTLSGILPDRQGRDPAELRPDQPFWRQASQGTTTWELTSTPPRRVIEVSWATVNVPSKPSLVFTFRDQSAIVQAQDKLIDARDQLEQQVAQRTHELRQARDEALAASQSKTRFLATMSHEIRTPLNAVIGMSDLLLASPMDGRFKEMIQTIHESGDYLLNLVNDILDISQIETGRLALNPRTFDLHSLLDDVLNLFQHQASIRQLDLQLCLSPDSPRWLIGDDLKLRQILFNLLGNACKYTNQGEIRLVVEATRLSSERVDLMLRVSDTGIGIAAAALPFIFEEFVGHANPEQTNQSAGLGLAICARLCQLMAGEISVDSSLGRGSCFSVRLPFAVASKSQKRSTEPSPSSSFDSGLKILVADDNRVNQRVLELMLARLTLSAQLVGDGYTALQSIRSEPIDLVFMDVEMPHLDGISAARQLRREGYSDVYIIALTAYSFSSHRQECEAAGMNDFLSKPLRFVDLCAALDRFQAWRRTKPILPS